MASIEAMECNGVLRDGVNYCNDGPDQVGACNVQENKNVGDDLLDDLDSYMEDINDRLTISRMVGDSVIKGMVCAISQEAADVVAAKELEVAGLKEALCSQWFGHGAVDMSVPLRNRGEQQVGKNARESLLLLNQVAKQQLERLEKCIVNPKEIVSASDMMKLGGTPGENLGTKTDMDMAFHSLKCTVEALCQQVDAISYLPTIVEWQPELEIRGELQGMIFGTIVQCLREEYERRLWDVNTVLALIDRCKEISSLRHDLDSIQKCLVGPEVAHLSPQGSLDADIFHRKVFTNHGLHAGSPWDGNGKCEESKVNMPEKLETSKLNHMTAPELYQYFRTEITKMKRDHESTVQQMTEEYFALKREILKEKEPQKERGHYAAFRKDKDFEPLRKKMPEVISKLDAILNENKKLSEFCNYSKDTLDNLLLENLRLRDLLNSQKLEACYLSCQASDATEKLSQHSLAEENLQKLVQGLKGSLEDACLEASFSEEVYKCILREVADQMRSVYEDLNVKSVIMQEITETIYEEAFHAANVAMKPDNGEILDLQSALVIQLNTVVFQETLRDMSTELTDWKDKCLEEGERSVFLETQISEIEKELHIVVEENKKLKHQALLLDNIIEDKDKALREVSEELNKLMDLRTGHEALITDRNRELLLLKEKLEDSQRHSDFYKLEIDKLTEALKLSEEKLRNSTEEITRFVSALEQQQNHLTLVQDKDREHQKQMKSLCLVIEGLATSFADFELRTKESIGWHSSRLENSAIQLRSLIPKVNVLRRTGLLYKERLEKRCSDLQKAESEVDLLGDEVDALLSLLDKVYVALDHYSPILQHYPGMIEILKLIRRELSEEALKPVSLLLNRH